MKKNKFTILTLLVVVGLAGSIFVYTNAYNADEINGNEVDTELKNQASLVDEKREVVTSDNDSEEINYRELVNSDIEKNINLNLTIENDFDKIQRTADIEIEKQDDMEMIKTVYTNTETGKSILVAQSTNELGNAEKYADEIKNKWYTGEKLEELLVKDYRAIVRQGSEDESGLYVVTNDYVYSFIGDRLDVLLELAEKTPFK
ncbi:hypothetical protein H9649_04275 [Sporosarcina sp. Sa2YVA2]|uniref:DUF4358 domain-containing protein n=1 Tax=Sporosarcina quadrami TaxID=2762234 RepID=A0ABR8U6Z0_9BACL|nr:hypothetical protein [Sporosarcina quadrami]MBD7983787.1 hypothetical protein [Sporosarcina quadrami]